MMRLDSTLTAVTDVDGEPASLNVSGERIEEYKKILHRIGSHRGMFRAGDGEIDIPLWEQGCAACGDYEKGYAFRKEQPDHLVLDIDRDPSLTKGGTNRVYQRLEGNWYVYVNEMSW